MENINENFNATENTLNIKTKKSWFKRKKKLVIWSAIGLVVVLLIVAGAIAGKKAPEYTTIFASRGELKQSVDATGKVESAETIELNFRTTGRIQNFYVTAGDEVKAGDRLAILEASALQSQVTDAQAKLNQARADHDKLLAGASSQDLYILENKLEQKRSELENAEKSLANLKITKETDLTNLKTTAITTLNNELSTAQGALEEIANTLTDSDASYTLSIKNTTALQRAEESQLTAENSFDLTKSKINLISFGSEDSQILNALDDLKTTLEKISICLDDVLDVLSYTPTSSYLTEAELDALKTNIKTKITTVNTSKTTINTTKSNWTNDIVYYADQIDTYEAGVITAQNNFKIAQGELDLKKAPPRDFEIDASLARVQQAQANLSLAVANLNNAIITAPVDGVITKKNLNVGEYASLANPVLEMIGNSNLQIEVDIPESDIAKITTGQNVTIDLDAFGSDRTFGGSVTFVDPAETIISDVVYYKVKVQFDDGKDDVKPGMTANVNICTNKKEDVIFVPARAVKSTNGDKYVDVITGRRGKKVETQKVIVTTGMRGDDGIEITSGLNEGDEVVTFVKE